MYGKPIKCQRSGCGHNKNDHINRRKVVAGEKVRIRMNCDFFNCDCQEFLGMDVIKPLENIKRK